MATKKCMQCGGSTKKMAKGGMPTKVLGPAKKPFAAGIPFFTGSGQTGPEYMQKGGSFAPNRAVQASCKNGMVRDENGRCVMERKMGYGGSMKKYQDGGMTIKDLDKRNRREFLKGKSAKIGVGTTLAGMMGVGAKAIADKVKANKAKKKEAMEKAKPAYAKGGFPDLNKDGKVTKADILKGRGVIKRNGGTVKKR